MQHPPRSRCGEVPTRLGNPIRHANPIRHGTLHLQVKHADEVGFRLLEHPVGAAWTRAVGAKKREQRVPVVDYSILCAAPGSSIS